MEYKITHYNHKKPIIVRSHERRVVRPYTKGGSWWSKFKRWVWGWLKTPIIVLLCLVIYSSTMAASFFGGQLYGYYHTPSVAMAQVIIAGQKTQVPPILQKIAWAETRDNQTCDADAIAHHFCVKGDEGNVLVTTNSNKSVDVGAYAVNDYAWGAQAQKLGLDIYNTDDNEKFAIWLFDNYGTAPWKDSEARWSK